MMTAAPNEQQWRSFGPFAVDLANRRLVRDGLAVEIEPKPFEILALLLAEPGRVVSYEGFKQELWPDIAVEVVPNLNTQVNKLRKALGETPDSRYILTKRGEGYFFNPAVPIQKLPPGDLAPSAPLAPTEHDGSVEADSTRRIWLKRCLIGVPAAVAGALGAAVPFLWRAYGGAPTAYRVEGSTLIVTGRENLELWSYTFPEPLQPWLYQERDRSICAFCDTDGDGRVETLFLAAPDRRGAGARLFCFDYRGRKLWEFEPKSSVLARTGERFPPPFHIRTFAPLKPAHSKTAFVAVTSPHHVTTPVKSRYWMAGPGSW
jgi:DNA-binding winged helix-turn-helix (wHTH) protein